MSGEWGAKEEKAERKGSKGTEIGREMQTANFCHTFKNNKPKGLCDLL